MSYDVVRTSLLIDVANAGTFAVGYPSGRDAGSYAGATGHKVISNTYGMLSAELGEVSFSFGGSSVTITNGSGQTLEAGTSIVVQLDHIGRDDDVVTPALYADDVKMRDVEMLVVNLGAPETNDPNGVVESQACTAVGGLATGINGAYASGGVATLDVPRALVAAWTTSAVLTVTGTDEYGNVIVESSGSGTSLTGKKAFKTITGVSSSVDITGLTVGTGKVLGLPMFLEGAGHVFAEIQDGAKATAGTTVGGDTTTPAATTGDVRGTYAPNAAPDGSKVFQIGVIVDDPSYKGLSQYAG